MQPKCDYFMFFSKLYKSPFSVKIWLVQICLTFEKENFCLLAVADYIKVSGCSQDFFLKKTAISPNQKKIHLMHQSPTSRPSYQAAEVSFSIAAMLHDARRHGLQPCLCWCGKAFGLTATSILDVRLAVGGFYWLGWGVSVITCQLYITMFNPQSGFWLCIFFGAAKETGRVWISSIG